MTGLESVAGIWLGGVSMLWMTVLVIAVRTAGRSDFRVGPDDDSCSPGLKVSIIIPARNEGPRIGRAVAAVLAQDHRNIECIVIDDGSTDDTAAVLASFNDERLVLLDGGGNPPPQGWLGKPWACHRASERATGDWLLFVDADVVLAKEAASRSVAYAERNELDALSGMGNLVMITLGEKVMQPVVAGLLLAGNRFDDVNDPDKPDKALANGQFMLFRRAGYDAVDGHRAVAGNVLDDVGMSLALKAARVPYHLIFMRRLFSCRMYESTAELWAGWRKNLFPGIRWSWGHLTVLLFGQVAIVVGPYLMLVAAATVGIHPVLLAGASTAVLAIQGMRFYMDGLFDQDRLVGIWSHGIANVLLCFLLLDSAVSTTRGTATWKGRALPKRQ